MTTGKPMTKHEEYQLVWEQRVYADGWRITQRHLDSDWEFFLTEKVADHMMASAWFVYLFAGETVMGRTGTLISWPEP